GARCALYSGPGGCLRFPAAIEGSAIHCCSRRTFSSCIFGICASTADLSDSTSAAAASIEAGITASAPADRDAPTKSRRLRARAVVSDMADLGVGGKGRTLHDADLRRDS